MAELEKVIKGLECLWHCISPVGHSCGDCPQKYNRVECKRRVINDAISLLKAQEPITGETSDGYHTFNELYHHRAVLFSVIVANYLDRAWKSKKHHDGAMYEGMFIVGIETPDGQATYHYDIDPYWDMFKCRVLDNAPEWDGHTPAQAIERIGKLKPQEPRVFDADEIVLSAEPSKWLWVERKGDYCAEAYKAGKTISGYIAFDSETPGAFLDCERPDEYGKTWRCWTSRPTDEQREKVKWE